MNDLVKRLEARERIRSWNDDDDNTHFEHLPDKDCREAAALIRAQAEEIKKLREEAERYKKLDREAATHVESVICLRSDRFSGHPPYVGWKGLGLALMQDYDELAKLRALARAAMEGNNER